MKFLVITKRLKIQDGRNYDQEIVQGAKSNDVRFLITLYTCQNCFGLPHMSLWQICMLPATILGYMTSQWPFSICRPKRLWKKNMVFPNLASNYANPVYGVATICHQVRWLRWGHPSLFHTATSLLTWYKMFCVREISYRLIWMEFVNMFSVYAQSGTHSRFNW